MEEREKIDGEIREKNIRERKKLKGKARKNQVREKAEEMRKC